MAGRTCQRARAWETRLTTWTQTQNAKRTLPLLLLLCVLWSSPWEIKVDLYLSICIFEFRRASQPILENLLTYTMELRKAKTDFLHNQSLTNTLNSSTALHPKSPHSWSVSHNSCRPCSSNWPQRPYTAHWHGVCRVLISSFLYWRRDNNSDNSAITVKFCRGLLSDRTTPPPYILYIFGIWASQKCLAVDCWDNHSKPLTRCEPCEGAGHTV